MAPSVAWSAPAKSAKAAPGQPNQAPASITSFASPMPMPGRPRSAWYPTMNGSQTPSRPDRGAEQGVGPAEPSKTRGCEAEERAPDGDRIGQIHVREVDEGRRHERQGEGEVREEDRRRRARASCHPGAVG